MQELLLILEDHWTRSPDMQSIPIFSASGLASQSLKVYQTYIDMMNDAIKQAFQVSLAPPPPSYHNPHLPALLQSLSSQIQGLAAM